LALGLPAPFRPVHIVLLELFMDLGASVAFTSEPPFPGVMRRPPRNPAARFLDAREWTAILAVGAALGAAVTAVFVITHALDAAAAQSAAVATWLGGHALVAWMLRADIRTPLRDNPYFPGWALAAFATAVILTATPAGDTLHLGALGTTGAAIAAAGAAAGVLVAAAGRRIFGWRQL
jgi:Ca2+-transporting ATPase